jgi:hypothetical protein
LLLLIHELQAEEDPPFLLIYHLSKESNLQSINLQTPLVLLSLGCELRSEHRAESIERKIADLGLWIADYTLKLPFGLPPFVRVPGFAIRISPSAPCFFTADGLMAGSAIISVVEPTTLQRAGSICQDSGNDISAEVAVYLFNHIAMGFNPEFVT